MLKSLPITKKQWRSKYLAAKRAQYKGPYGRGGSGSRSRIANDLREIRAGKRYAFKK